jgi:hypothetical protein
LIWGTAKATPRDWESSRLPSAFGPVLTLVAILMVISFPLKTMSDRWHLLETASSIGLLVWIVVASVVLLLRSGPRARCS